MKLMSINVGLPQKIDPEKSRRTAIYKRPVQGSVRVTIDGLDGDDVADKRHHGGADQAVYLYGWDDYLWFQQTHAIAIEPGLFGENLTIDGLESAKTNIGDRYEIGDVVLEATASRIPCGTLALRMNDKGFIERFRAAERPGVYCRVIRGGTIAAGQDVRLVPYDKPTVSNVEMFRDFFEPDMDRATIERYLNAPIAERARKHKQEQLAELDD